ncbi:MAG: NB-ARC domain-containing protein [Calothrix sp. MO_167.B42]|nr:NB-ARC domain-containing protein [Calothrix sp. MO_167.B42]
MNTQPIKYRRRRKRGVILTSQGFQKLHTAKCDAESRENSGNHYTLEALSSRTGLDANTLMKVFGCQVGIDKRTLKKCFEAFNLLLEPSDYQLPQSNEAFSNLQRIQHQIDWGKAPDVSVFYGRKEELAKLEKWVIQEHCRLVTILGMGGIGKTSLSVKFATQVQQQFEFVIWRSLYNPPPIQDMLADLLQLFSNAQETNLPKTIDGRISRLISYFKLCRCLLILDNVDNVVNAAPNYNCQSHRQGYESYDQLFRQVGEIQHQSCLLLTSREKPKGVKRLTGKLPVRVLQLKGLLPTTAQEIFQDNGSFSGSIADWKELIQLYAGNPLALNIAFNTIQQLFDGSISDFLNHKIVVFGDIHDILQEHFKCLSDTKKQIIKWLAMNCQPISFLDLREKISPPISPHKFIQALESLQEQGLIERNAFLFFLQPLVREYINNELIDKKSSSKMKYEQRK